MSTTKITLKVFGFYQDGGDGGGGTSIYNSKEHYVQENLSKFFTREDLEHRWEKALEGDDPYEDGEISIQTIELEFDSGEWKLAKSVYFHWGQ